MAVVLMDRLHPSSDGFEAGSMIREHPRSKRPR